MHIIQVVQEFSVKGGVESVAYELQQQWRNSNVDSTVLAGVSSDYNRVDVKLVTNPFSKLSTRGGLSKYLGRLIVVPSFTLAATLQLRHTNKDSIILSHGDSLIGDALIVHAVNKASLKEKQRSGKLSWMLNPMHWWVGGRDRYMIGGLRYQRYIALSTRIADELHTLYAVPKDRISIIPNGVNIDKFTPFGPGRDQIRQELSIHPDAKVLLFVGHEFKRKGLLAVVRALARLPEDFELIVVGNDYSEPYKNAARAFEISNRIHFLGPRQDLPEIYRAVDAFVFPTAYEAFGLVTMEALASGVPIFATRVGGIEDYLKDGYNGKFITHDPYAIAQTIRDAFADHAHYEQMKLAARTSALEYDWKNIAAQYYNLLTTL